MVCQIAPFLLSDISFAFSFFLIIFLHFWFIVVDKADFSISC